MSRRVGALAQLFFYGAVGLAFNNPLWQDPTGAAQTLHNARPDLKIKSVGGYSWFNGGDLYKTKFEAIGPDGQEVKGAVTEGLFFKGSTIRYEP